jgi:hypothetical protein
MNIEKLEINLFKVSEIKDGDVILVKVSGEEKANFKKENIEYIYNQIKKIAKKDISIYFFPKNLSIDIIKNHVKNIEDNKEKILQEKNEIK